MIVKPPRRRAPVDTLLVAVDQTGPACHTGATTCFTDRTLLADAEAADA